MKYFKKACITLAAILVSSVVTSFGASAANAASASIPARQMERLDRGIVAVNQGNGKVYVGWRLLGTDPESIAFNLYRKTAGGNAVKLNSSPVTSSTNYVDTGVDTTKDNVYFVKTVLDGMECDTSEGYTLSANTAVRQYIPIKLKTLPTGYYTMHINVGDLDGDGKYDYIVKRMNDDRSPVQVEAYKSDGTFLWRIDLGPNIDTYNTAMTSPLVVSDLNSDGKAEVLIKTSESTRFGDGTVIGDTNGDGKTNYCDKSLTTYQVLSGPEFISVVDGMTGKELSRADFIARGNVSDWGDNYGNRASFVFMTTAYLDGIHPSVVMSRGPGDVMKTEAWDFKDGKLVQRWKWDAKKQALPAGKNFPDFHAIRAVDVDKDGKDEISWGGSMLDDDGKLLYATELTHGDRFVIGDIDPDRDGLECYAIQQNNPSLLGAALYDAGNGSMIKKMYMSAVGDVGRGDCADIDPNYKGMECWSTLENLYNCKGDVIGTEKSFPFLSIWWDGDLLREFFIGVDSNGFNAAINKWNYTTKTSGRLYSVYQEGVKSTYAGRPPFYGDILGDWREEFILETTDNTELRIYTTTIPTEHRIYTLMQNPAYRNSVDVKGYLSSVYPDFYLGEGMKAPPAPNIYTGDGKLIKALTVNDSANAADWRIQSNLQVGDTIYGDRTFKFTQVPQKLLGSEWIRTACDSKMYASDEAGFTAKSDITVYAGLDTRATSIPSWLSGWTSTGETITSDNSVTYSLYKKDFAANSAVLLGTNGASASTVNYIVAVTPKTADTVKGDVNDDGAVNALDFALLKKYLLTGVSDGMNLSAADLNSDDSVNAIDLALLKSFILGNA
ncbi:MAG TPA: dockerin type I domain-containing protein [Ruminiclostridium sp.]|nr:dockerin type I domain-containing protein [Ruminiclostridium sp.]